MFDGRVIRHRFPSQKSDDTPTFHKYLRHFLLISVRIHRLWCKERILFDSILEIGAQFGATGLGIVLVLCSFGFPMAKSLVIVFGGILAGVERGNAVILFLAVSLGLHGGDFALFLIGRRWGKDLHRVPLVKRILPQNKMDRARAFIERHGAAAIMMARITPVIRTAIYVVMGSSKMCIWRFSAINYSIAVLYSSIFFGIGMMIGNNQERVAEMVRNGNITFAIVIGGVAMTMLLIKSRRHPRAAELAQDRQPF